MDVIKPESQTNLGKAVLVILTSYGRPKGLREMAIIDLLKKKTKMSIDNKEVKEWLRIAHADGIISRSEEDRYSPVGAESSYYQLIQESKNIISLSTDDKKSSSDPWLECYPSLKELGKKKKSLPMINPKRLKGELNPGGIGCATLPQQMFKKLQKSGLQFTIMAVGESGLGKSTLLNSLFVSDSNPERSVHLTAGQANETVKIESTSMEICEDEIKIQMNLVDTPGFGVTDNNENVKHIIHYIDNQFDKFLKEENDVNRQNIVDGRVHCCIYFISPLDRGLNPRDIEILKQLDNKVNIVLVIGRSDCLVKKEVILLKNRILHNIENNGINIYKLPSCDTNEDEDYKELIKQLKDSMPFAISSSMSLVDTEHGKVRGRLYPWGVLEIDNEDHCDFIKLRRMLMSHMQDLHDSTHSHYYEKYRSKIFAEKNAIDNQKNLIDELAGKNRLLEEKENELRKMKKMMEDMQEKLSEKDKHDMMPTADDSNSSTVQ